MTILIIGPTSPRSPSLHEKSRENYKPLAHIRALFLESVPDYFRNLENPIKNLVHSGVSLSQVYQILGYRDSPPCLIESPRRSAAMPPQSLRVRTLSDARRLL